MSQAVTQKQEKEAGAEDMLSVLEDLVVKFKKDAYQSKNLEKDLGQFLKELSEGLGLLRGKMESDNKKQDPSGKIKIITEALEFILNNTVHIQMPKMVETIKDRLESDQPIKDKFDLIS